LERSRKPCQGVNERYFTFQHGDQFDVAELLKYFAGAESGTPRSAKAAIPRDKSQPLILQITARRYASD
jgi:hypothetical protein